MCRIEREEAANGATEAAEADIPADAAHLEDADMASSEAEGVELEEIEAVPEGEAGKPTSWWMFSLPRPGPDASKPQPPCFTKQPPFAKASSCVHRSA